MNHKIAKTVLAAALLAGATTAWADSAKAAYKRGQTARAAGRIHEACGEFEASEKLEAKVDTELSLASCYADDGRVLTAAKMYRTAAETDANAGRKQTSLDKAMKLEAKAPKLRLTLSARPEGLAITVDGQAVPLTGDIAVDAGPHEVVATAPGFTGHASAAVDKDRAIVDVIVRMEPTAEPSPTPTPAPAPTPAPEGATVSPTPAPGSAEIDMGSHDHRRRNGLIVGAVGVAALVTSGVYFGISSHEFDREHSLCPNAKCATDAGVAEYNSRRDKAREERGAAYGTGIGGVVLVGAGVYLMLTHKSESHVAVSVDHGGGGMAYTGHF